MGKSLKVKVLSRNLSRFFSEDYGGVKKKILDPGGLAIRRWNKIFIIACFFSLFIDPLFFLVPVVREELCVDVEIPLQVVLTILRSLADVFYVIQIIIQFRTAYVAPSSRIFGRGELVIDTSKIALRYLSKGFWIDFIAALPLTQVLVWVIIPNIRGYSKTALRSIIGFQYIPRVIVIFPLALQIVKAAGAVTQTAWVAAAFNLVIFLLFSHTFGAGWYLLAVVRQESCWISACDLDPSCQYGFFNCQTVDDPNRVTWFQSNNVTNLCNNPTGPSGSFFNFGMYANALMNSVTSASFLNSYLYCLSWGVMNVSSSGQNLTTSIYFSETLYATVVGFFGVVLFVIFIWNMQTYLQSATTRLEEWRMKIRDTEKWMHHRQLPPDLRQSVRKYNQYKWVTTRGVDEEAILNGLPMGLRRDIKRYLCLDLVRRVPLFDEMDERMLDAICERLKPALCTEGTILVCEDDPVNEILFIIRGHLDSYTTNSATSRFYNSCRIGPGDFCGDELLTWALDPRPSVVLPSSTRTVKAVSQVEAFALMAEDLKFVALQFRRLNSKQLRHKFRFYSHQWRTWAACFIQAAWRRFKERKDEAEIEGRENSIDAESTLGASSRRSSVSKRFGSESGGVSSLQKPTEPDFSLDEG